MKSPNCHIAEGLAWPENGARWIDQSFLVGPADLTARYALMDRSHDEAGTEVEWKVTLGDDAVKIERREGAVTHLPREIPYEDFTDVVLWGALSHSEDANVMVGLSLYSAEHGVQVPVCIQTDVEGLASYWTAWSAALGISPKVLDGCARLRDPFHGMGRLMQRQAQPRRLPSERLGRGTWMPSSSWRASNAPVAVSEEAGPQSY